MISLFFIQLNFKNRNKVRPAEYKKDVVEITCLIFVKTPISCKISVFSNEIYNDFKDGDMRY